MSRKQKKKSAERNRQKRQQQKNQKRIARQKEARKHGNHRSRKMEVKGFEAKMQELQEKHEKVVAKANELIASSKDEVVDVLQKAKTEDGRNCFEVVQELEAARNEVVEGFNKEVEAIREQAEALQKVMAMNMASPERATAGSKKVEEAAEEDAEAAEDEDSDADAEEEDAEEEDAEEEDSDADADAEEEDDEEEDDEEE